MAQDIGPGDWVEFYRHVDGFGDGGHLTLGAIYQVREVGLRGHCPDGSICDCIRLVGIAIFIPGFLAEAALPAEAFRPIYRPKSHLLESLLRKADEPVEERA